MSFEAEYQKVRAGMTREQRRRHRAGTLAVVVPLPPPTPEHDEFARFVRESRARLLAGISAAFTLPAGSEAEKGAKR
jgi:hypothetical protein